MKSAKRKPRIYEVPISYHGPNLRRGKKIGWKDGIKALGVSLHFWLIDDLYVEPYGRAFLNNLTGTPQYLSWHPRELRPFLADTVLEPGAERDPLYLHALGNRFLRTPNVYVASCIPAARNSRRQCSNPPAR